MEELSGKTMNVLHRATSIRGVRDLPHEEARRLESDWNAVFTKIGIVQGHLKARRKELRSRSALANRSAIFLAEEKCIVRAVPPKLLRESTLSAASNLVDRDGTFLFLSARFDLGARFTRLE